MSFPSKSVREACWNSKDKYWECLDLNNEDENSCSKWKEEYQKNCSELWVKHFNKKRRYEKYKEHMDKSNWTAPSDKEYSSD